MAALVEGVEYGLSSLGSTSSNKSVLYVKLTDSALKAIEEYNSFKENRTPQISFEGQQGVISIPGTKSGAERQRAFNFTLATIQGDPKGSFDCVQQNASRSSGGLELLGSMQYKVSIHANEDSYKTTRERMTIAEEESKKSCAKEIKYGNVVGKRVKVVKKHDAIPPPASSRFIPINPSPRSSQQKASSHSSIVNSSHHSNHVNSKASPQPDTNSHHRSSGGSSGVTSRHSASQRMSPSINHHVNGTTKCANPEVLKKPLRERIIHLLAMRPYKKIEIVHKLKNEGVKEKDKSQITSVLQQVGTFNAKENAYILAKHLYSQVKLDWPDYKEEDIVRLKRKLALENRSSTPPSVSPAVSPVHSIGSQGSPTNQNQSQKRSVDSGENQGPHLKKARIAHSSRKPRHGPPGASSPRPPSPSVQAAAKHNSDINPLVKSSRSSNHNQIAEIGKVSETNNNLDDTDRRSNNMDGIENQDFINKYSRIDSLEQRQMYKSDFNREYEEYRELHGCIEKSTLVFQELRARLYQEEEGSQNYENIKEEIVEQYKALKKDAEYSKNRKRCEYLHKKLGHIKKLILDYDQAHLIKS